MKEVDSLLVRADHAEVSGRRRSAVDLIVEFVNPYSFVPLLLAVRGSLSARFSSARWSRRT